MNQQKEASKGSGIVAQVAIYTASAAAGLFSMWATIRDNFYRGITNAKWTKELKDNRNHAYDAIEKLAGEAYSEAHKKIGADYSRTLTEKLREKGFTNSWKKFKFLTMGEKAKVVGIAVTVGAVAVGAMTNIRQNRQLARQLEEMDRKNNADKNSADVYGR